MIRILILSLLLSSAIHAQAKPAVNGVNRTVVCTEDNLPDGDFQEYELRMAANGKYEVLYRYTHGDMRDGPGQDFENVIMKDLTCHFGTNTDGLSNCEQEDGKGNSIGYFNTTQLTEKRLSSITGKEQSNSFSKISMNSEILKANYETEGFPLEATKQGSIYYDFMGTACRFK